MNDRRPWELTDEEIAKMATDDGEYGVIEPCDVTPLDHAIATAAQKRLVEYMEAIGVTIYERQVGFIVPILAWQDLKAALGVK